MKGFFNLLKSFTLLCVFCTALALGLGVQPAAAQGQQYTLTAINNSSNEGNIAVFQKDPDLGVEDVFSLAWFSKFTNPDTQVKFNWTID